MLRPVDQVEILTLSDNYTDLVRRDMSEAVTRALPIDDAGVIGALLAEHGFSVLLTTRTGEESHEVLFDFGLTHIAVPFNARTLGVDLSRVEAAALSHGHGDHYGSLLAVLERIPGRPVPLFVHPSVFKPGRYVKEGEKRTAFPPLVRAACEQAGAELRLSTEPTLLAGDTMLFLGEIERTTAFEHSMPNAYVEVEGVEHWDPIEDDTAMVINLRKKGLLVVSGCAHSGIVNTVEYARKVTGVDEVHLVMGGFHLAGPAFEAAIAPTTEALKRLEPAHIVPTHCTGREAIMAIEAAMPGQFILNVVGTRLTFTA